jgi:hypothetical protein
MPFDNPFEGPLGDIQILMDARRSIADPSHWLQGGLRYGDRYCLVAAISRACRSSRFGRPNETERRLIRLLDKQLPRMSDFRFGMLFTSRYRLMMFNDYRLRQHEDVLALFDRAIGQLRTDVPIYAAS